MSRADYLLSQCEHTLVENKRGAPATRKKHLAVMRAVITDLHALSCLPPDWGKLNNGIMQKLVNHWLGEGHKTATIGNKLSIVRAFLAKTPHKIILASNSELLPQARNAKPVKNPVIFDLNQIESGLIKTIVEFELYFGLTLAESLQWPLFDGIDTERLLLTVPRTIAYSKKRRDVPILTAQQQCAIENRRAVLNGTFRLSQNFNLKSLMAFYHASLNLWNIKCRFRDIYINERFVALKTSENEASVYKTLMAETGIKTTYALKQRLWRT